MTDPIEQLRAIAGPDFISKLVPECETMKRELLGVRDIIHQAIAEIIHLRSLLKQSRSCIMDNSTSTWDGKPCDAVLELIEAIDKTLPSEREFLISSQAYDEMKAAGRDMTGYARAESAPLAAESRLAALDRAGRPVDEVAREIAESIVDQIIGGKFADARRADFIAFASKAITSALTARDLANAGREERLRAALERARQYLADVAGALLSDNSPNAAAWFADIDAALSQLDTASAMRDLKHGGRDYSGDLPEKEDNNVGG